LSACMNKGWTIVDDHRDLSQTSMLCRSLLTLQIEIC
jgi:hypothetical protein